MNGIGKRVTSEPPIAEEKVSGNEFLGSCSLEGGKETTDNMRSKAKARKLTNTGEENIGMIPYHSESLGHWSRGKWWWW